VALSKRQFADEVGLECVGDVEISAPNFQAGLGVVQQRLEVALRSVGIVQGLAEGVTGLDIETIPESTPDFYNPRVIF